MNTTKNNQTEIETGTLDQPEAGGEELEIKNANGTTEAGRAVRESWGSMRRRGKVARLPLGIREEVNCRLENGEEGQSLLDWLNGLPVVQELIAEEFAGVLISKQNLSEWRAGGFREWLSRQELLAQVEELSDCAKEIEEETNGLLVDKLGTIVAARYAALLAGWDGEVDEAFEAKVRVLRRLCQDVVRLQRSMHRAEEQQLKLAQAQEKIAAKEEQQAKRRALAPILAPMRNRTLAEALGGTAAAAQVAAIINAVNNDLPLPGEEAENAKGQIKSEKLETEKSDAAEGESNPVKPSQTNASAECGMRSAELGEERRSAVTSNLESGSVKPSQT